MNWNEWVDSQPALAIIPLPLWEVAMQRDMAQGEVLSRMGDPVRSMVFVLAGELRLVRRNRCGTELVLQRASSGFLAEASLYSTTYHCDIVAAAASTLVCFPIENFRPALDEDKRFRDAWMVHLAREVRGLRSRCERMGLHSASDRILHYLESEGMAGQLVLSQSRKAWAAELGLTHESLYRTLSKLRANGVLAIDGKRLAIDRTRRNRHPPAT